MANGINYSVSRGRGQDGKEIETKYLGEQLKEMGISEIRLVLPIFTCFENYQKR